VLDERAVQPIAQRSIHWLGQVDPDHLGAGM
jgi:hypothetical protein